MKRVSLFVIVLAVLFLVGSTSLHSLVKVGETVYERISNPHPYNGTGVVYERIIHSPGAGYISIHFSKFDLAPGDYVLITNGDESVRHAYRGKGKDVPNPKGKGLKQISEFWASYVPGDTAVIRIYSKSGKESFGFEIDQWVRGYERDLLDSQLLELQVGDSEEAICTADDKEWAKCYAGTTMYDKSKAVCRLLINGSSACTGWLLGSEGHIMTNNHCIDTQADADNTEYEFMAEGSTCTTSCSSWFSCAGTKAATSGTMVKTSSTLDYTLVKLPGNLSSTYGYMQLRSTLPTVGERIYIPQHPAGKGKMIAVNSDVENGYCKIGSLNEAPCMGGPGDIGYYADTEGGSSGSPVLAYNDHLVVALHHCANCPNRGVPIPSIITDLGSLIPADAIGGGIINPGIALNEALDYTSLTVSTSGSANWTGISTDSYYGGDSAKSGSISDNQESIMQTSVNFTAAKTVSFYWKVSSESNYDFLKFYVDGVDQGKISGNTAWAKKSVSVASGTHILKWVYSKDYSVSSGSDCGWVDRLEISGGTTPTNPFGEAVEAPTVTFNLSGDGNWLVDSTSSKVGSSSVKSPTITHSKSASFDTTKNCSSVSFYWKVSSESNYDYLEFYVDGVRKDRISGTVGWTLKTYTLPSGSHTLKWVYTKDYSVSSGSDCGWVDNIVLQ